VEDSLDLIRVVSRREAIKAANLSERTWERLEAKGDVPPKTQLSEGRIGYRVIDIVAWLDKRRVVVVLLISVLITRFFGGAL
jgi:predicted DNA-binding transcriptional regulator AlpA